MGALPLDHYPGLDEILLLRGGVEADTNLGV